MNTYIVIRFSIQNKIYKDWALEPAQNRIQWLKQRIDIFKKLTLPSLNAQTHLPNKVFLIMDKTDQNVFEKELSKYSILHPVFVEKNTSFGAQNQKVADEISKDNPKDVLFSRMDSDDIISSNYIESLIHQATSLEKPESENFLIVPKGYITDLTYIQSIEHYSPPFVSVYQPQFQGRINFGGNHEKLHKTHTLHPNKTASWMIYSHGKNIVNSFYRKTGQPLVYLKTGPIQVFSKQTTPPSYPNLSHLKNKKDLGMYTLLSKAVPGHFPKWMHAQMKNKQTLIHLFKKVKKSYQK